MNCPRCIKPLERGEVDGIELDVCLSCRGTWFDDDELRQAKDLGEPDANWLDFEILKHAEQCKVRPDQIKCPRCGRHLCAVTYGETNIEIDVCPSCHGVWLDADELGHIIDALNDEINSRTFADYLRASIEEAIEIITGPESFASEWRDFKQALRLMHLRLFVENPKLTESIAAIQRNIPM